MSEMNHARAIRNLASMYREMEAAAAALETIGSVSQAVQDLEAKRKAAEAQLSDSQRAIKAAEAEAAQVVAKAEASAQQIIAEAEAARSKAQLESEAYCRKLAAEARDEASAITEKAVRDKHLLNQQVASLTQEVAKLGVDRAAALEAVDVAKNELKSLEAQLAALKDKFKNLIG